MLNVEIKLFFCWDLQFVYWLVLKASVTHFKTGFENQLE